MRARPKDNLRIDVEPDALGVLDFGIEGTGNLGRSSDAPSRSMEARPRALLAASSLQQHGLQVLRHAFVVRVMIEAVPLEHIFLFFFVCFLVVFVFFFLVFYTFFVF